MLQRLPVKTCFWAFAGAFTLMVFSLWADVPAESAPVVIDSPVVSAEAAEDSADAVSEAAIDPDTVAVAVAVEAAPAVRAPAATVQSGGAAGRTIIVPSSGIRSIGAAMAVARAGDTVRVKNGTYRERVAVSPGVFLAAENLFKAVINGGGRGYVVTMGAGAVIRGFDIRHGTAGVFADVQSEIRQCRITRNFQSGIMCVGALPLIEDNVIAYNRGTGVQGWDLRRVMSGSVNHNTIAFNNNHGIALGGNTLVLVENNIIAFNDQFGIKPTDETVRVELVNNNFYQNTRIAKELPPGNMAVDPLFYNARRVDFRLQDGSRCAGADNQNLGARVFQ